MTRVERKGQDQPTLREAVLRVEGNLRQHLAPLRVTPLQAGVILYLHRKREAKVTETATGVGVAEPTLSVAVRALFRKRWVTRHRIPDDRRVVYLWLTQRGEVLARRSTEHALRYEADTSHGDLLRLGQRVAKGAMD
ncbi:MAG: MarR family winged helix-turn-helix transcriptional regulator [Nitrospiraceae bacterium]